MDVAYTSIAMDQLGRIVRIRVWKRLCVRHSIPNTGREGHPKCRGVMDYLTFEDIYKKRLSIRKAIYEQESKVVAKFSQKKSVECEVL